MIELYERVGSIEGEISKALNTLSEGVAENIGQVWENQQELAKALDDISNYIMQVAGEGKDEEGKSTRP